jgi:hypothetical protein
MNGVINGCYCWDTHTIARKCCFIGISPLEFTFIVFMVIVILMFIVLLLYGPISIRAGEKK